MSDRENYDLEQVVIGDEVTVSKTVGEVDVYLYAGITGDNFRNHIDEEYMKTTVYGGRIAQGALLIGFMGAASSIWGSRLKCASASYGYDKVRFIKAVKFGDTITTKYTVVSKDAQTGKSMAEVRCYNQHGEIVAAATHINKFFK